MEYLAAIFVVFAVTLMLTDSEGPFSLFAKLRGVKHMTALRCFLCTSVYVSAVVALTLPGVYWINLLALSGAATAIDRQVNG